MRFRRCSALPDPRYENQINEFIDSLQLESDDNFQRTSKLIADMELVGVSAACLTSRW